MRDPGSGLLVEALELLREADRMHRQFFTVALGRTGPSWEPPVDMVESDRMLEIQVALPGVAPDALSVSTNGASLHVAGLRRSAAGPGERIHRLEIPYGRFERRIELPPGRYELRARELVNGCLVLKLHRIA
jgi:HSP20 family molecular chaperone IbpA